MCVRVRDRGKTIKGHSSGECDYFVQRPWTIQVASCKFNTVQRADPTSSAHDSWKLCEIT